MNIRPFVIAFAAAGLVSISGLAAVPAEAASSIQLRTIYVNSPGSDNRSNSSLNAEYATLKNTSSTTKTLTGMTVRDASGHVYKFGTFKLSAGASVRLHTGTGTNTASHRYWGSGNYIWNNSGDTARLKSSSGTTLDTCSWGTVFSTKAC
jgi:hypothetical protein